MLLENAFAGINAVAVVEQEEDWLCLGRKYLRCFGAKSGSISAVEVVDGARYLTLF
jgi:hypothetical protein